jgi:hypothetical protein
MCFSGRRVYPFDVQKTDVLITDIAHSLSMQVRYNGHVARLYTVGEHCIRISDALLRDYGDPRLALKGLLHDAGETYTGDFIRPVKNSLHEVEAVLKAAEDRNEHAIMEAFDLADFDDHGKIKDYDRRIIVDEKEALFGPNKPWDWDLVPLGVPIIGYSRKEGMGYYNWDWERVADEYLARFYELSVKGLRT